MSGRSLFSPFFLAVSPAVFLAAFFGLPFAGFLFAGLLLGGPPFAFSLLGRRE